MRIETRIGLLMFAVSVVVNRFAPFPDSVVGFISGICLSLGIFLLIVGIIPENRYNNLLYRRWIAKRNG